MRVTTLLRRLLGVGWWLTAWTQRGWPGCGGSASTSSARPAGCARIELVTADLAASYRKAVAARVPQARVVYDRIQVERLAADAVDEVRPSEQNRLGKTAGKALKRTRYALLKHPARLQPGEARRLARLRRQNRGFSQQVLPVTRHSIPLSQQATQKPQTNTLTLDADSRSRSSSLRPRRTPAADRRTARGAQPADRWHARYQSPGSCAGRRSGSVARPRERLAPAWRGCPVGWQPRSRNRGGYATPRRMRAVAGAA